MLYKWKQAQRPAALNQELEQLRQKLKQVETERDSLKKSLEHFLPSGVNQVYQVIATQAADFAGAALCQSLGVSRSGYYAWRQRAPAVDPLTPQVRQVFQRHARRYGVRRITAELQAQGHALGRRRVRRILRAAQLHAIQPKSFAPRTTDSRHGGRMSPKLLAGLTATRPGQAFVSRHHVLAVAERCVGLPSDLAGFVHAPDRGLVRGREHEC